VAGLNWALAVAAASLLIAIHPGLDLAWLAWIALAPLLIAAIRERRAKRRFLLGWTAGVLFWFVHCNWIQFVLEVHGGMGRWGGWGTFLLFCVLKAVHLGLFATLAGGLAGRWWSAPAMAALWVGLERTHGTFGFAWLALGNAGIDMPGVTGLAPWVGVYGLSFVFALAAASLATRKWAWLALGGLPLVLSGVQSTDPTETAAVVQPNLDEETQWTSESLDQLERRLLATSLETAVRSKSRLIIWPESPGPLYYFTDPVFKQYATDLARTAQAHFLFGTVGYTKEGAPLNTAVMLSPGGELVDRYDKIFLVPFGEFIPPFFGFVNRITQEAGDFTPGNRVVALPFGEHKLGTFICYESAFPHLVRRFTLAGADALINLSNDGYFGRSYAREQHLKLVRMRAVENRRWIVRSTNDGITAVVDPGGRVKGRLEPFREKAAAMRFGYASELTPYARYGDWFAWACLLAGVGTAASSQLARRRRLRVAAG
jgi:apolipoprotein N-acyltransferase